MKISANKTCKILNKKNVNLGYVDHFDYKLVVITKINMFKSYMDTTYIDEASLRFQIYYSKIQ